MNGKLEKEKKSEDRIFDSYLFVNHANKGKIGKVKNALKEYRKTAKDISKFLWDVFFLTDKLSHRKKINIKHTYYVLSSYIANIQRKFFDIMFNSTLNKEDKLILLTLDNVKDWLVYDKDEIEIYERKSKSVEKEWLKF